MLHSHYLLCFTTLMFGCEGGTSFESKRWYRAWIVLPQKTNMMATRTMMSPSEKEDNPQHMSLVNTDALLISCHVALYGTTFTISHKEISGKCILSG